MNQFDIKELFIKNINDNTTLNIALALVEEWSNYKSVLDKIKEELNDLYNADQSERNYKVFIEKVDKLLEEINGRNI